jgi:hypothetical protein
MIDKDLLTENVSIELWIADPFRTPNCCLMVPYVNTKSSSAFVRIASGFADFHQALLLSKLKSKKLEVCERELLSKANLVNNNIAIVK